MKLPEIGITGLAHYLPQDWMSAAQIAGRSGIPEEVIAEKFGVRGKHIAADGEHVSDMSIAAGEKALADAGLAPSDVNAVIYFGSTWKDHPVWHAAPRITHELGATNAFALELDYVSCGSPVALRVARNLMRAEEELERVLIVAAAKESHLIDYDDPGSRFTYNFGDGATAAVLQRDTARNTIAGCHMITDGSFSHHVKVPAGGSALPASHATVDDGEHLLRVEDAMGMKERLDPVTLSNFVRTAEIACEKSGIALSDVDYLCGIHMKKSMHDLLMSELGVANAAYLNDTGHMSGVDPLLALDRAVKDGTVRSGDNVLTLAAGTGYTWAAAVVRWGEQENQ